jgi:AraC-like DNA-binding protein
MFRNASKPYSLYLLHAVKSVKQHIEANPFHYKRSAELLDHLCMPNRNSVERAFKDLFGVGIKEYQVRQRLEVSKEFLEEGMTKKQVASKCFYSSQSAFAAAFRKEFNMTPSEWQALRA